MTSPWTVRMKASTAQRERIKATAAFEGKEIGEWILAIADAAALTALGWRQMYFTVQVPDDDWNVMLTTLQLMESRFAKGISGLSSISRTRVSLCEKRGMIITYRTSTQMPESIQMDRIVAYHLGDLGVRFESWATKRERALELALKPEGHPERIEGDKLIKKDLQRCVDEALSGEKKT